MSERQILSVRQAEDVKIMQKVNGAHREAFAEKYPGQVEHCLRLVMERPQVGLDKRDGVAIANPDTWSLNPGELADLSTAAKNSNDIRNGFHSKEQ